MIRHLGDFALTLSILSYLFLDLSIAAGCSVGFGGLCLEPGLNYISRRYNKLLHQVTVHLCESNGSAVTEYGEILFLSCTLSSVYPATDSHWTSSLGKYYRVMFVALLLFARGFLTGWLRTNSRCSPSPFCLKMMHNMIPALRSVECQMDQPDSPDLPEPEPEHEHEDDEVPDAETADSQAGVVVVGPTPTPSELPGAESAEMAGVGVVGPTPSELPGAESAEMAGVGVVGPTPKPQHEHECDESTTAETAGLERIEPLNQSQSLSEISHITDVSAFSDLESLDLENEEHQELVKEAMDIMAKENIILPADNGCPAAAGSGPGPVLPAQPANIEQASPTRPSGTSESDVPEID
jgi:hypothetical protein